MDSLSESIQRLSLQFPALASLINTITQVFILLIISLSMITTEKGSLIILSTITGFIQLGTLLIVSIILFSKKLKNYRPQKKYVKFAVPPVPHFKLGQDTKNTIAPNLRAIFYILSIRSAFMSIFMVLYRAKARLPSLCPLRLPTRFGSWTLL